MNKYKWKACPLCDALSVRNIGPIEYRQPIMFSTEPIVLDEIPYLCICDSCGSWFTQNIVDEKDALDLYKNGESNTKWPRQKTFAEEKPIKIVRRLDQYFREGKRVLDIGCNTGLLLDYAQSKGCTTNGVEPSLSSQIILKEKGHHVFSSLSEVAGKYDVITAFDLVEHLYDLPGFMGACANLLSGDGVIILLTGNIGSFSAWFTKANWWYLKAPEHIVYPSITYFQSLKEHRLVSVDKTYASVGYMKPTIVRILQLIRKTLMGNYDGTPPLLPDHMLVVLARY